MASTSSLLKSAASTKKKIQAQEDAIVAFNWENSAQTYNDYKEYSDYLKDRQDKSSDPSQSLSYEKTIRSARRSYTSNEIQRQTMAIMEGEATTQDKLNLVGDFYQQALDNGDYNLAQNLASQWDSLSIKLQNEQQAAVGAYQAAGKKASDNLMSSLTKGVSDVTLPTGQTVTPLAALEEAFTTEGNTVAVLQAAQETMEAVAAVVIDKYQNATSQEEIDKLEQTYGAGLKNLYKEVGLNLPGVGKINAQEVVNALANDKINNPMFGLAQGEDGSYKLKRNNVEKTDYVRTLDENGEEVYMPARITTDQNSVMFGNSDQGRGLSTQLTNEGAVIGKDGDIMAGTSKVERDGSQSIENRLKSLGIIARQNGTTLVIKLPGENVERTATIQPDGSVRYMMDSNGDGQLDQIKEIGLVDRKLYSDSVAPDQRIGEKAGEVRDVSAEEISDFGTKSAFGGTQSQTSKRGQNYLNDITGKSALQQVTNPLNGPIRVGNDFGGAGTAVTSNLLQTAGQTKKRIEDENKRQFMLQSSSVPNLNQTPVAQYAGNGVQIRQLQVAPIAPPPKVTVAAPAVQRKVTVAAPAPAPKVKVATRTYTASNKPSF